MTTLSHHFLRRRARARAHAENVETAERIAPQVLGAHDPRRARVERASRGPFRYRVVRG